jgi:hypothetical protein
MGNVDGRVPPRRDDIPCDVDGPLVGRATAERVDDA